MIWQSGSLSIFKRLWKSDDLSFLLQKLYRAFVLASIVVKILFVLWLCIFLLISQNINGYYGLAGDLIAWIVIYFIYRDLKEIFSWK
jgi:hypothetical protein